MKMAIETIAPGFWKVDDVCNVYIMKHGRRGIAIDFGSGQWLERLSELGIDGLDHVLLTHHHDDQCSGLAEVNKWPFEIHAPAGEDKFLDPEKHELFHRAPWYGEGCPESYSAPRKRIHGIKYDLNGFGEFYWDDILLRILLTPGHGRNACSFVIQLNGKQFVCCGDAVHADATIWEVFHLEWDHWTGNGALAAWEGIERLRGIGIDMLCPSHGPVIRDAPRKVLAGLSCRLLEFYRAKGQISEGITDIDVNSIQLNCGAREYLPSLCQFGINGYLLVSKNGEALVVDPCSRDLDDLYALCEELKVRPTASIVSHYHFDHCDATPILHEKFGSTTWLHPRVAEPWTAPEKTILPWLEPISIGPYELMPSQGTWSWNEYEFIVAPWPGQTWWHCVFMTIVDGHKVLFGGDSFQPSAKWNGTGGFCAFNNSRLLDGFVPSAELAINWKPEIIAAGHGSCYFFSEAKFVAIKHWAEKAHASILALCPHKDLELDYYAVFNAVNEDNFYSPASRPD